MSTTLRDPSPAPASTTLVGKKVGKYEIVRVIGKGGMGCVYEAVNTVINKHVAMKCIDHALAANDEANARFQREAVSASAVDSAHIVQIFDAGSMDDGTPFIVMELLRGQDLGGYITERGKLELDDTLQITAQILKGLHHAHDAGIVHRDLKPDNVFLVEREGEPLFVKLLDFGVSKISRSGKDVPLETLTRQGTVVGTPYYMSPEQAQAFPDVDGRTDIYSVGAIMYECLAARPPQTGQSYEQVIVNICMKDIAPLHDLNPSVPVAVSKLVHKALGREREDRFASAREMLDALIEVAPSSLRLSAPSGGAIRVPAGAATTRPEGTRTASRVSYPTTRQIIVTPTEQPSELAKTVPAQPDNADLGAAQPDAQAPDTQPEDARVAVEAATVPGLSTSGVNARLGAGPTEPPDLEEAVAPAGVPPRRSWLLAAVPLLILAGAGAIYLIRTSAEGPVAPDSIVQEGSATTIDPVVASSSERALSSEPSSEPSSELDPLEPAGGAQDLTARPRPQKAVAPKAPVPKAPVPKAVAPKAPVPNDPAPKKAPPPPAPKPPDKPAEPPSLELQVD